MDNILYSLKDLTKVMKIGITSAYELVNSKDFPRLRIGKRILIPKKALEKWIEDNRTA